MMGRRDLGMHFSAGKTPAVVVPDPMSLAAAFEVAIEVAAATEDAAVCIERGDFAAAEKKSVDFEAADAGAAKTQAVEAAKESFAAVEIEYCVYDVLAESVAAVVAQKV